jgi:hypothetical protein
MNCRQNIALLYRCIVKELLIVCILVIFPFFLIYGQKPTNLTISNIDFNLYEDQVIINYDLTDTLDNCECYIEMEVYNSMNEPINAKTIKGDVNKLVEPGKDKFIIWEIKEDYPDFNDSIFITIIALKYDQTDLGKDLLLSTIYPGLTQYRENKKKSFLILGLTGYGLLCSSFLLEKMAMDDYNKYKNLEAASERDVYFNKALHKRKMSNSLLYSGLATWAINYGFVIYKHRTGNKKLLLDNHTALKVNFQYNYSPGMAFTYSINF